ncbi:MAG: arsenite methyltransferase [Verrucomicrobia bacterium]|nr:arsenite methyltransferase [Verrucomicrobiota bacterium]
METNADRIRERVREGYGTIAVTGGSCCASTPTCCGSSPAAAEELVKHIGYSAEELAALPEGANMGLSCGNPNALAALQPGEVVLDLGAGGGFDVFIASRNVGPTGRAIGVDMTPEMLAKARRNLHTYRDRSGLDNVEFRLGEIEHLPVPDHSVDVVISNCVINLSPDKPQVWREIFRVLKPGGRVAVSDLALLKPLPAEVLTLVEALVGCVAGAVLVGDTERMAREAGLTDVVLNAKPQYVEAMTGFEDPLYQKIVAQLPAGTKPSDYLVSLEVQALKPATAVVGSQGCKAEGSMFSPAVGELVAIGAAVAANCEPCLKYHYDKANQLGLSKAEMAHAVSIAAGVKTAPHRAILRLADRLTGHGPSQSDMLSAPCCSDSGEAGASSGCCSDDSGPTAAHPGC